MTVGQRQIEVVIDAPPSRLWWACSTLDGLRAWQADDVRGRVGLGATLEFGWPGLGLTVDVQVTEYEPQRKIEFATASWRLGLELAGPGLVLTLAGPTSEDELEGAMSGWALSLALLRHQLERHWGYERTATWVVRSIQAPPEQLHVFFSDPLALRTWLGSATTPVGASGERAELDLVWGARLSGEVLAHTPRRDLALSWEQQGDSVLSLRSLPSPRTQEEWLVLLQWSRWREAPERVTTERELEGALTRLANVFKRRGVA